MKKLKPFLAILLALSLLLCFVSCGEPDASKGNDETTTKQEEVTTPAVKTDPVSLTIKGTNISEYTIVFGAGEYAKVQSSMKSKMEGDLEKNEETASRLIKVIQKNTGVTLKAISETTYTNNLANNPHVIFIGKTSYNTAFVPSGNNFSNFWSATSYNYHAVCADMDNYTIALDGNNNISICGGTFGTTYHAVDAIETWLKAHVAEGKNAVWDETVNLSGSYHIKVVACIGDSITEGCNATSTQYFSYVANLNRLLWQDYYFINYGVGGKTMRSDLNDAYQKCPAYTKVMDGTIKYDIVTLMLGTNDSNRDYTPWSANEVQNFKTEMNSFIADLFENCNYDVTFMVMNCPAYYGTTHFGDEYVQALQLETAKEIYSTYIYDIFFFDMNSYSDTVLTNANFPDNLHPNDAGYFQMAEGIADALEDIENGKTNPYFISLK